MGKGKFRGLEGGTNILAGATIHNVDETGETYNYMGFLTANGTVIILRTDKSATIYRYFIGNDYDADWAARASKEYDTLVA